MCVSSSSPVVGRLLVRDQKAGLPLLIRRMSNSCACVIVVLRRMSYLALLVYAAPKNPEPSFSLAVNPVEGP